MPTENLTGRKRIRKILGFDPGSKGGFGIAILSDTADILDTAVVPVKPIKGKERFHHASLMEHIWESLSVFNDEYKIDYLFYERVHAHNGVYAAHKYGAQIGLIQFFCQQNGIAFDGIPVQHAKVVLAGFATATKKHMVAAAQRLGYHGDNHNEADAIGVALAGLYKHFLDSKPTDVTKVDCV